MKALLIIPPAPARWPALQALPIHEEPLWQNDLEKRFAQGVSSSQDAFAILPDGGHILGCAGISKRHDLGVLTRAFVHSDHRGRGLARGLLEALLAWFDMTGGIWLYATATADLAAGFLAKFGFRILRRAAWTPQDVVVTLRTRAGGRGGDGATDDPGPPPSHDPLSTAQGDVTVHDVSRANWPSLCSLLYNRPGPDPRVALDESAVVAEITALDLLNRQELGTCHLKAAFRGPRLIALASIATDQLGDRTYAMIMPHTGAPPQLRETLLEFAHSKGYEHVDFPLEALAANEPAPPPEPAPPVTAGQPL